jgi:hypothetical protein
LSEERVERDSVLCEPLNEDVGFFVNLNLGIKSRLSCAPAFTCLIPGIYLPIEHILYLIFIAYYIFSSVDLTFDCSVCSLVGRLTYSALYTPALL